MVDAQRTALVAPCGIDCGVCELYTARYDEKLRKLMVSKGIPESKLPCDGCRNIDGKCPVIQGDCKTYSCVKAKGVEFCHECGDFPCVKLHPSANRADILPHNMKVFNLCTMKRVGVERFTELSPEIKKRYYMGKMDVGNGPQV